VQSLGFVFGIHFGFHQVEDEAVDTFSLGGSEVFDDLPLTFLDNDIDMFVGFLIVSCGGFLLSVGILQLRTSF